MNTDTPTRPAPHARRASTPRASGPHSRWRRLARRGDSGSATVEFVIAVPLLMLMILFIAQAAVWMHATHVAQAAAAHALDAARASGGSPARGQAAGLDTLHALASTTLNDPTITVTSDATEVQVDITGTAATVVPGIHWSVRVHIAGPVERFVPDPGR